ncbi:MAG: phage tail tape measure protein, partial [Clostridia bacterium]|nr:phage tail tape measure protein [Clostridia bacterium]
MGMNVGEVFASFTLETAGFEKTLHGMETSLSGIGKTLGGLGLTEMITRPLLSLGQDIFETGTQFETTMTRVRALVGDTSETAESSFQSMRQEALRLGEVTSKTASQAAEAMESLAMAGFSHEQISESAEALIRMAEVADSDALGQLASYLVDTAMAFNAGDAAGAAGDMQHFADVMVQMATSTDTSVEKMGQTFANVAAQAGTLGLSIEDVSFAAGIMANAGIKASKAGTDLRTIFQRMSSDKGAIASMEALGVSMFDAAGNARQFRDVLGDLRTAVRDANLSDQEMQVLAKSLGGARSGNALLSMLSVSEETYEELIRLADTAGEGLGAAAEKSEQMLKGSLQGQLKLLDSALGTTKIMLSSLMEGTASGIVESLTGLVRGFNGLEPALQSGALHLGGFLMSLGPVISGMGTMELLLPRLGSLMAALVSPAGLLTAGMVGIGAAFLNTGNVMGQSLMAGGKALEKQLKSWNRLLAGKTQELQGNMVSFFGSLAAALRDVMPSLAELSGDALIAFTSAISGTVPGIAESAGEVIRGFSGGLSAALPRLVPEGMRLAGALLEGTISNIPSLADLGASLLGGLLEGLTRTDFGELASGLAASLQGALSELPGILQGLLGRIGGESLILPMDWDLENAEESLRAGLSSVISGVSATARELLTSVQGALEDNDWSGTGEVMGGLGAALLDGLSGVQDALTDWTADLSGIQAGLTEGLGQAVEAAIRGLKAHDLTSDLQGLAGLGAEVMRAVSEGIRASAGAGAGILDAVSDLIGSIRWEDMGDAFWGLSEAMVRGLSDAFSGLEGLVPAMAGLTESIQLSLTRALEGAMAGLGSADLTGLADGLTSLLETAISSAAASIRGAADLTGELVRATSDLLSGISWAGIGESLSGLGIALEQGVLQVLSGLGDLAVDLSGLGNSIYDALRETVQGAAARLASHDFTSDFGTLSGIAEQLISSAADAIRGAAGLAGQLVNALGDLLSGISWAGIGESLSGLGIALEQGIIQILSGLGDLV